jgi:hypothetical protein
LPLAEDGLLISKHAGDVIIFDQLKGNTLYELG